MAISLDLVQYGFSAGELAPNLLGASDLDKYGLGLELAQNWFVDYQGGLSNRPGSIFVDFIQHDDQETATFAFKFAPDVDKTYVLLLGDHYIRFIQDGAYIVEAGKNVTGGVTAASPGVVGLTAHGYVTDEWLKADSFVGIPELNGRTFQVGATTANTFQLLDAFGREVNTALYGAYVSGGTFYRIYTVVSPYDAADLPLLRAHQSRSQVTFTHPDYKVRDLVRVTDTSWTLTQRSFQAAIAPPTGITLAPSVAGTFGIAVAVTSIDIDGNESIASEYAFNKLCSDYATTADQVKITWTPIAGAIRYNVYRSIILPVGADISRAQDVGLIGTTFGPQLIDRNLIPDFTKTPPGANDPFADSAVSFIQVLTPGTGYLRTSTVGVSGGGGTGFVGYPIVDDGGGLLGIVVQDGGHGFSSTVVAVSDGTGATFGVQLTPSSGNDPSVSTVFQQRNIFSASLNKPLTTWGSKPGSYNDMNSSSVIRDSDSYEFDLDSDEVAPIKHLLPSRSGLVMFSQTGIWQLTTSGGGAVTPTDALADPQSYTGTSDVEPITVDTDILYVEGKGTTVRLLEYSDQTKVFAGQNMSLLSNHLMTATKKIVRWSFAADPFKLVHAVRSDGVMLTFTIVKEQKVFAWTHSTTFGLYEDVIALQENNTDAVYQIVSRPINGRWTKFIEKVASRQFDVVEDAWFVDAGLALDEVSPAANLTPAAATGFGVTFTASAAIFTIGDVGKIIRVGGGKAEIVTYTDTTHVVVNIKRDITAVVSEDPNNTPLIALSGDWTMDTPATVIDGLWHLEGMEVSILADGNVVPRKTVELGKITLDHSATRVIVGLPYRALARSLSPTSANQVIENKLKRNIGVHVRMKDTRGLQVGQDLDNLSKFNERSTELPGEPTNMVNGVQVASVDATWNVEGNLYYLQDYPLPATILSLITAVEVGEDANS